MHHGAAIEAENGDADCAAVAADQETGGRAIFTGPCVVGQGGFPGAGPDDVGRVDREDALGEIVQLAIPVFPPMILVRFDLKEQLGDAIGVQPVVVRPGGVQVSRFDSPGGEEIEADRIRFGCTLIPRFFLAM